MSVDSGIDNSPILDERDLAEMRTKESTSPNFPPEDEEIERAAELAGSVPSELQGNGENAASFVVLGKSEAVSGKGEPVPGAQPAPRGTPFSGRPSDVRRTMESIFTSVRDAKPLPVSGGKESLRIAPDAEEIAAIERLLHRLPPYYSSADYALLVRAYMLASAAHGHQRRESGEPYILHPIAVAQILVELGVDPIGVAAGLLHDVAEDSIYDIEYIKAQFGPEISMLVDGVTKLKRINEMGSARAGIANHKAESLRKMFIAMVDDVRVVIIKLADRLHNMRTLAGQKEHKRRRIARETLEIFAPLANRLGICPLKSELDDLSFRFLEPATYKDLMKVVFHKHPEHEKLMIVTNAEQ